MPLLLAPVLLLLLRLSAVGFRLASLGGARDPHHGFALTPPHLPPSSKESGGRPSPRNGAPPPSSPPTDDGVVA